MSSLLALLAQSAALLIGVVFVISLLVGSFLNVVIHRKPVMLEREWQAQAREILGLQTVAAVPAVYTLSTPRSACPRCAAPIKARQNIPIISWLLLRGRCAACANPISARYPVVELLTAVLSAAVAWKFGFGWPMLAALVFTWFLIALCFIDIDTQLLPDDLTLPLFGIGLFLSLFADASGSAPIPVAPRSAVIGALIGYFSLWSVNKLYALATGHEGMGEGDFKLLGGLGCWLGWQMLLPIVLMSAAAGAAVGISLIVLRGRDRKLPMAFGPYLAAAGWMVMMCGHELVARYLGLIQHSA